MSFLRKEKEAFREKVEESYEPIMDNFEIINIDLNKFVKDNNNMLNIYQEMSTEFKKDIQIFKTFGDRQTPGIKSAMIDISTTLESTEENRLEMIENTKTEFIDLLNEIDQKWTDLRKKREEKEIADAEREKAKEELQKIKTKQEITPKELETAEADFTRTYDIAIAKHDELIDEIVNYNTQRVKLLKEALKNFIKNKIESYEQSLKTLRVAENTINDINEKTECNAF